MVIVWLSPVAGSSRVIRQCFACDNVTFINCFFPSQSTLLCIPWLNWARVPNFRLHIGLDFPFEVPFFLLGWWYRNKYWQEPAHLQLFLPTSCAKPQSMSHKQELDLVWLDLWSCPLETESFWWWFQCWTGVPNRYLISPVWPSCVWKLIYKSCCTINIDTKPQLRHIEKRWQATLPN